MTFIATRTPRIPATRIDVLPVQTPDTLAPAASPTLAFVGVTTGGSSIQRVFPLWAAELGLPDVRLQGVDLPVGAPADDYRRVLQFLADDPLTRGAQVTSHKIGMLQAAEDLFGTLDPLASMMGEVSCVAKRDGRLAGFAKDPITAGLALDAFVPSGHWAQSGAQALVLGAGGAGVAIVWYLSRAEHGVDRPSEIVVTDRSEARLAHLRAQHEASGTGVPLRTVVVTGPADSDAVLAALPARSLVVNATGLGKDGPGSPIGPRTRFPRDGFVWELNYRGDLEFLDAARAQSLSRRLVVEDGWTYFLHGWLQAIAEVFEVDVPRSGPAFERLGDLARSAR